jgi:hypothetical protein
MTKEDAKSKTLELAERLFARVEGKINNALNSGCIDLDAYQDDYVMPKIILNAVMQDLCSDTKPLLKKWQKEADNIYKFL